MVPALLAPWWIPAIQRGAAEGFLLDVGRLPAPIADGVDLATGRLADLGAPWWLGAILAVLALLALVPRATRIPVLVCWVVALVAALLAAVLGHRVARARGHDRQRRARGAGRRAAGRASSSPPRSARSPWCTTSGPWRRVVAVVVALAAVAVPVGGLVWWLGPAENTVAEGIDTDIPVYMVESSEAGARARHPRRPRQRRGRPDLHGPSR